MCGGRERSRPVTAEEEAAHEVRRGRREVCGGEEGGDEAAVAAGVVDVDVEVGVGAGVEVVALFESDVQSLALGGVGVGGAVRERRRRDDRAPRFAQTHEARLAAAEAVEPLLGARRQRRRRGLPDFQQLRFQLPLQTQKLHASPALNHTTADTRFNQSRQLVAALFSPSRVSERSLQALGRARGFLALRERGLAREAPQFHHGRVPPPAHDRRLHGHRQQKHRRLRPRVRPEGRLEQF
mmetsp:Transcript_20472/g.63275  ORF Transcript_20472/g.63275 Transcript_20472/m.63275 type:complete len:239 (-) Transcript_20472:224-940(-)